MGAPRFEKHVMLAFADEANSKLRMPEGPLNKLWGWKCSTPAEHVFDPCSRQLGGGSHVCMRGRGCPYILSIICTEFVSRLWSTFVEMWKRKIHYVLALGKGWGMPMLTWWMDGPWKHVLLIHFFLSIRDCLGCRTSLDADVPKLVLLSSCQNDNFHRLQQSQVDTERCIRVFKGFSVTVFLPKHWVW